VAARPQLLANGDLDLGGGLVVRARDIRIRATTSGGPGGQHANRTLSRIVATLDVAHAASFTDSVRARLLDVIGPVVSASSSGSRSQAQNRVLALDRLAHKVAHALSEDPERRPTKPTRSSVTRRLGDKKKRAELKATRQTRDED
jgi:ribosome-associated protein